jgi:hypothetical protein
VIASVSRVATLETIALFRNHTTNSAREKRAA